MSEERERFEHLYSALVSTMEVSRNREESADKASASMVAAALDLRKETDKLIEKVNAEFKSSTKSATDKVSNDLIKRFEKADYYAEKAAKCYKFVAFWTPIKYFLGATILSTFIMILTAKIVLSMFPNSMEIQKLSERKSQLDKYISDNQIEIINCGDGLRCVKVNKDEIMNGRYFTTEDGSYAVLDGQ